NALVVTRPPTVMNDYVTPVDPPNLVQSVQESSDAGHGFWIIRGQIHEHADAPRLARLLRPSRHRPRDSSAAEQRDHLAPFHSITSSARASSVGGTVKPSMRAVSALMTSSNFDDCTTGRSAGLAPFKIRPT